MSTCSVTDCQRPVLKRGWCNAHYLRWYKHGDPEQGGIMRGSARDWILERVEQQGDKCLIWPFAKNPKGYGDVRFTGMEGMLAHRVMCTLAHGEPPESNMDTAHSCGVRDCMNPNHLSWKTRIDNHADKQRHGTQIWGEQVHWSKLTYEQALRVKYGGEDAVMLADEFGVSPQTIGYIRDGRTWKGL